MKPKVDWLVHTSSNQQKWAMCSYSKLLSAHTFLSTSNSFHVSGLRGKCHELRLNWFKRNGSNKTDYKEEKNTRESSFTDLCVLLLAECCIGNGLKGWRVMIELKIHSFYNVLRGVVLIILEERANFCSKTRIDSSRYDTLWTLKNEWISNTLDVHEHSFGCIYKSWE